MRRHLKILVILFLVFWDLGNNGFSQNEALTTKETKLLTNLGKKYLSLVDSFSLINYDSVLFYSRKASLVFFKLNKWSEYVNSLNTNTVILYNKREFKAFKEQAFLAFNEAKNYLSIESEAFVYAQNNLGGYYTLTSNIDKGILLYKELIEMMNEEITNEFPKAVVFENLAKLYSLKNDFGTAISYLEKAYEIRLKYPDKIDLLFIANSISRARQLQKLNKLEEAIILLEESEDWLIQKYPLKTGLSGRRYITIYEYLAEIYRKKRDFDSMNKYLEKVTPLYNDGNEYKKYRLFEILGDSYIDRSNWDDAINVFRKLNSFFLKHFKSEKQIGALAESNFKLAVTYNLSENNDSSFYFIQSSLNKISSEFDPTINLNPEIKQLPKRDLTLEILMTKAEILYSKAQENNWKYKSLIHSYEQYQYLSKFLNLLRFDLLGINAKQLITEKIHTHFEKAIQVSLKLYDLKKDPKYLEQAYHFAEQNKAITLQESIQENLAKGFGGIPDSTLEKEKDLRIEIAFYEKMIYEEKLKGENGETEQISKFDSIKFELKREYENLVEQLESDYPKYHELKYKNELPTVADIQNKLKEGEALLEYFVGEDNIFVFVFTKAGLEVVALPKSEALAAKVEQFRNLINRAPGAGGKEDFRDFASLGYDLYQMILEEPLAIISKDMQKLIIVPDDVLTFIPFEVLLKEAVVSEKVNYSLNALSYLFEDYQISYSSSSALWLKNRSHIAGKGQKAFLGFAPTFGKPIADASRDCTSDELYSLNCNEGEIEAIRNLIGGDMLAGLGAEKRGFEQLAPDFQILHLATHACVDDEDPMFNKIWLSDDYVSNHDLYNLQLNADLAVLSACNTGSGKLVKGEGVQSLARGFLHAGCPSLVTSLWSVDDCATSDIMVHFYTHLKGGKSKDEALRLAKMDYLNAADKLHQHPYYWGAFVQIGNSEALDLNRLPKWWAWGGLALLLLGFLVFIRKTKVSA